MGNESLKSMVKFNLDSYLLGLNSFETIAMTDHVTEAMNGMKKKLAKVTNHLDSIEKKQAKFDSNCMKMMEKLKAYRELKREVDNLKRAKSRERPGSKEPNRRGQGTM